MAVELKWVNANAAATKKTNPALFGGQKIHCVAFNFEVAAADDDGSIYKLGRLPANAIPVKAELNNDAITGGTDYDLGLYKQDDTVADANILADALDMSAAAAISSPKDGLKDLGGGDPLTAIGKKLWELLGQSKPTFNEYTLALTANTVGSAAGTIAGRVYYLLG